MTKTTLRGHCPCCGNLQAVPNGLSKHGYTVAHGWFQGVCSGEGKKPMEQDRTVTEQIAEQIRNECLELDQLAADLEAGRVVPKGKTEKQYSGAERKRVEVFIAFADLPSYAKVDLVRIEAWKAQRRAKVGRDFANYLLSILDRVHGQALIEEAKKAPAAPICRGDRKVFPSGLVLVADYVQGARVYYNGSRGWVGTQKWRSLPDAA
jgi:hypothetical protein